MIPGAGPNRAPNSAKSRSFVKIARTRPARAASNTSRSLARANPRSRIARQGIPTVVSIQRASAGDK
jgi:hypothetical protein